MSKKTTKAQTVDARLFQQLQPHGGITFAEPSYIRSAKVIPPWGWSC